MSRRNMSERAMGGLMLCDATGSCTACNYLSNNVPRSPVTTENDKLNTLNSNIPNGVDDKNKFRLLARLLQNIGKSNTDGSTPIDTNTLEKGSTKLLLDFIKEAVPASANPTADKATTQTVLSRIKETFGLSDNQIQGLQRKIDESLSSSVRQEQGVIGMSQNKQMALV